MFVKVAILILFAPLLIWLGISQPFYRLILIAVALLVVTGIAKLSIALWRKLNRPALR